MLKKWETRNNKGANLDSRQISSLILMSVITAACQMGRFYFNDLNNRKLKQKEPKKTCFFSNVYLKTNKLMADWHLKGWQRLLKFFTVVSKWAETLMWKKWIIDCFLPGPPGIIPCGGGPIMGIMGGPPMGGVGSMPGRGGPPELETANADQCWDTITVLFTEAERPRASLSVLVH